MFAQIMRFGLVGACATAVHIAIGLMLIHAGWLPLVANLVAFLSAFFVSFVGHFGYSFAEQEVDVASALLRFIIVAIIGFAVAETVLAAMLVLELTGPTTAFLLSVFTAAACNFVLSRNWAFRGKKLQRTLG